MEIVEKRVFAEMFGKPIFDYTFCKLGEEGQVGDWTVAGKIVFVEAGFFEQWRNNRLLEG